MNKVISFSSGKGGVGKTTLVANLGTLLSLENKRTLLVDGDWTLGKLGIALGVRSPWTIADVLAGGIELSCAITPVKENLSLLPAPTGSLNFEELGQGERQQLFFLFEELHDQYDYLLLDHSSGVHPAVTQFAAASHEQVIVTTAEPTSLTDAYAIMKILSKRFGARDFSLLVTMSQSSGETEKIISRFRDVATSQLDVRVSLLEIFPWEPKMSEAIRRQQAFVTLYPQHESVRRLHRVCRKLEAPAKNLGSGLKFFFEKEMCALSMGLE